MSITSTREADMMMALRAIRLAMMAFILWVIVMALLAELHRLF
jgi:hypothetical protein